MKIVKYFENSFSTYQCFDQFMQRTKKTLDYVLHSEVCVMLNVVFCSKARAAKLVVAGTAASLVADFHNSQSKLDDTLDVLLADMSEYIYRFAVCLSRLTVCPLSLSFIFTFSLFHHPNVRNTKTISILLACKKGNKLIKNK